MTLRGEMVIWSAAIVLGCLFFTKAFAQGTLHDGSHHSWPVAQETMTVTGTVIVDASFSHPMYLLDENGDAVADYHLAFGPWWYEPASGAVRPSAGETVTVVGTEQDVTSPPILVVFELNGLAWRDPVEYGRHGWNGAPFWDEQGDTLRVTGTVLVDSTYFYHHYFLDIDQDTRPDYQLGLGPAWYDPSSGATRPQDGETVTVWGIVSYRSGIDHLSVYELNGQVWRPFNGPAPWAGTWIRRDHADTTYAYCVNDSANWIGLPPGHMGHGMGGMRWPDSTFVQFWQIHPDSLPGSGHVQPFMGFFLDVHDPTGTSMMTPSFGGGHGRMRFEQEHRFRLHYYDDDVQALGFSEEELRVQFWDEDVQQWREVTGVTIDTQTNAVTFASTDLSSHYALVSSSISSSSDNLDPEDLPTGFILYQNYPNPFNPTTTISYELSVRQRVVLAVYDLLGREVTTLVDAVQSAGRHRVVFDGEGLSSGVYIYRLESDRGAAVKRLALLR